MGQDRMSAANTGWHKQTVIFAALSLWAGCSFDPVARVGDGINPDGATTHDGSSGALCQGTCQECLPLNINDCGRVGGCTWNSEASCSGTCMACSQFVSQQACDGQIDCQWQAAWLCQGQCPDCASLADQTACGQVEGCNWGAVGEHCVGQVSDCDSYDQELACRSAGCEWRQQECQGSPKPCDGRPQLTCFGVCDWVTIEGCRGSCRACDSYQDQTSCEGQPNCQWTEGASHCTGQCRACENFVETNCGDQSGCQWEQSGSCQGSCRPCASFDKEDSCNSQPGCHWVGS